MLKRTIALILSIGMLIAMYSCGTKSEKDETSQNVPMQSEQPNEESKHENDSPQALEPSDESEEANEIELTEIKSTAQDKVRTAMETLEVWDGSVAESFDGGDGSSSNPYLIANGSQLAKLAMDTNSGADFSGKYFILTSDILLNDLSYWDYEDIQKNNYMVNQWEPIGLNYGFEGHFDGNEHVIFGLFNTCFYRSPYSTDPSGNIGLFGSIKDGYVSNVSLICCMLEPAASNVGGVAGECVYDAVISNCHVYQTYVSNRGTGTICIGGVCGSRGDVRNSSSQAYVSFSVWPSKNISIGGIVGSGSPSNCYSDCEIYVNAKVGYATGRDQIYRNFPQVNVGGISGDGGDIESCFDKSDMTVLVTYSDEVSESDRPSVSVGGICGKGLNITNSASIGSIRYEGDVKEVFLGGISGKLGDTITGGFSRELSKASAAYCYTYNKIISEEHAENIGGITGSVCGDITITNCYYGSEFAGQAIAVTRSTIDSRLGVDDSWQSRVFTDQIKGLSYEKLLDSENYYGWNFDTIWTMNKNINDGLPMLFSLIEYI